MNRQLIRSYILLVAVAIFLFTVPVAFTLTDQLRGDTLQSVKREAQTMALLLNGDDTASCEALAKMATAYREETHGTVQVTPTPACKPDLPRPERDADLTRGGHVRVNGERVKPAYSVRVGDEVRVRQEGRERIVVVKRLIRKRVGAPVAVQCYVDNSPPPPPREAVAPIALRDRGAGRPTKRDRRELERLRGLEASRRSADHQKP
jgi:ribosomal 50S subunit-recycling heat shock protein